MIKRQQQVELLNLSKQYPVITITGPRQAGKTTLAQMTFPEYQYCNLELPELRSLAKKDPKALFHSFPAPVIIDEIQRVPELLSYIQVFADRTEKKGQYILTGSHQMLLLDSITQSLAGRTALLNLFPLSIKELADEGIIYSYDEYIYKGFLPRIYKDNLEPTRAYRNYFQTYVERDVRQLVNIKNITYFENFIRMLAGRAGQLLNLSSLANDIGISSTTLSQWLSVLEASFIIFRIKPFFKNFGKRIVKSPKLYFTDIGLASYLIGINDIRQVNRDPLLGGLFENLVVMEAVKARMNQGLDPDLYFFRDNNQHEVDLIYKRGRELIPIEIKSAMTYNNDLIKNVLYFNKINKSPGAYLVYNGDLVLKQGDIDIINFKDTYKIFI